MRRRLATPTLAVFLLADRRLRFTDGYAYLATIDLIAIACQGEAGTAGELSFGQPLECTEAEWERVVRDAMRDAVGQHGARPARGPGGGNFMMTGCSSARRAPTTK